MLAGLTIQNTSLKYFRVGWHDDSNVKGLNSSCRILGPQMVELFGRDKKLWLYWGRCVIEVGL